MPTTPRLIVGASILVAFALTGSPAVGRVDATPRGATVTIAAAGDIALSGHPGNHQTQTAALITDRINPIQVLELGDAQYEKGEYAQFLNSYDPTWGAFKDITAPVLGNHEYETKDASGYFKYFKAQLAGQGAPASDPKRGYYSFDLGSWHIVALNSNCSKASCPAQVTWLKSDLSADDHFCELVFYHHASQDSFPAAAAGAGADLILVGHKHRYERWDNLKGLHIRQLVVGTGGRSSGTPAGNADAGFKGYGVARLDLSASSYTWQFIDVGGTVRDSGSDGCSA